MIVLGGDEPGEYLDWKYAPGVVPQPERVFEQLAEELGFDAAAGTPSAGGAAATLFQPPEARQVRYFGKVHPLPFRQAFFAATEGLREPKLRGANPSLIEREHLQPVHAFGASPALQRLRSLAAERLGVPADFLNYCNVNLYAAGDRSKLGAHADQDHGDPASDVVAASVTLMRADDRRRRYVLRGGGEDERPAAKRIVVLKAALKNGSMTVLGRRVNRTHTHEIPAQRRSAARVSVNFRHVVVVQ
jgi:hypothetical protein